MELFVIDRPRGDPQLADFSTSLGVGVGAARYGETYLAPLRPPKTRTESEQASRTRPLPPVALLPRAAIAQCSHGTRPWHSVWQPTAESGSIRVNGPGFAGPAARLLAALRAAPRAIAPRAMTSLNATTSSKGIPRSRKLRIAAAPVLRNQPISTRRVTAYNVYMEGPGRGYRPWRSMSTPRQFLRVDTPTPRPLPGFFLRLRARSSHRSPNNNVRVGRKDQR